MSPLFLKWGNVKRLFYFAIILFLILSSSPLIAGLSVNPSIAEIVVEVGKENLKMFTVGNTGKNPINVRIELEKVDSWLIFQVREFEVRPKEEVDILYAVIPPKDASGELRARVTFVADEIGTNRSPVGVRFSVPIYAVIQNTVKLGVDIKDMEINYDVSKKILSGSILVENLSNVHIRPYIDFAVEGIGKSEKSNYEAPYGQVVQKGMTKPLFLKEEDLELLPGRYKLTLNLDYGRMHGVKDYIVTKKVEFTVE